MSTPHVMAAWTTPRVTPCSMSWANTSPAERGLALAAWTPLGISWPTFARHGRRRMEGRSICSDDGGLIDHQQCGQHAESATFSFEDGPCNNGDGLHGRLATTLR